jgi:hypothetical protein
MASSRTFLKITLVIAALIVASTVIATTPIEARSQTTQWTWNGGSAVSYGYPVVSTTGNLLLYSTNGTLYTVSPQGNLLWNSSMAMAGTPQFSADGTVFALVSVSPIKVNGTELIVLSPAGVVKWNHSIGGIAFGMNVLADGGVVLGMLPTYNGQVKLECLNSDGSTRWTKGTYDLNETGSMMYPIGVHGNNVMVSSTKNVLPDTAVISELRADGTQLRTFNTSFAPLSIFFALDGTMRTVGYHFTHQIDYEALYCLRDNGSVVWSRPLSNLYSELALLPDGTTLYAERNGTSGLDAYAVDADGNQLWVLAKASTVPVAYHGNALVANSTSMMLVDNNGYIIWKLNGTFYGQPAVYGNTIYAGTSSGLAALSESVWKISWQPIVLVLSIITAMAGVFLMSGRTPKL